MSLPLQSQLIVQTLRLVESESRPRSHEESLKSSMGGGGGNANIELANGPVHETRDRV